MMKFNFHKRRYIPARFIVEILLFIFAASRRESYLLARSLSYFRLSNQDSQSELKIDIPKFYRFTFRQSVLWALMLLAESRPTLVAISFLSIPLFLALTVMKIIKFIAEV